MAQVHERYDVPLDTEIRFLRQSVTHALGMSDEEKDNVRIKLAGHLLERAQSLFAVLLGNSKPDSESQTNPHRCIGEAVGLIQGLQAQEKRFEAPAVRSLDLGLSWERRFDRVMEQYKAAPSGSIPEAAVWFGLAKANYGAGRPGMAIGLIRKVLHPDQQPLNLGALLAGAVIAASYGHPEEGISFADRAAERASGNDEWLKPRALHARGVNLLLQARAEQKEDERSNLSKRAEEDLTSAFNLISAAVAAGGGGGRPSAPPPGSAGSKVAAPPPADAGAGTAGDPWRVDPLLLPAVRFDLALLQAEACRISDALDHAQEALKLSQRLRPAKPSPKGTHLAKSSGSSECSLLLGEHAWRLLVLLLTCEGMWEEAEGIADAGLQQLPPVSSSSSSPSVPAALLMTKAKVQLQRGREAQAVETVKQLLSRLAEEKTKGESSQELLAVQETQAWALLTRVYLAQGKTSDAEECTAKAKALLPFHADTFHASALLSIARKDTDAAIESLQSALLCRPQNTQSRITLAQLLHDRAVSQEDKTQDSSNALGLAKACLKEALSENQWSSASWNLLGTVCKRLGQEDEAEAAFGAEKKIKDCSPVEPFHSVPFALLSLPFAL